MQPVDNKSMKAQIHIGSFSISTKKVTKHSKPAVYFIVTFSFQFRDNKLIFQINNLGNMARTK